ncbi:hypothetical protein [Shewanella fidelis]|uniref:Phage abortive infection protein n=1 Tax=Shewanella fidelis TaxID=173509 RepID=A0AAW8NL93_9GAMM|nr:hypothetical protein [Shewanella fidelis]MDR8523467.1 hypothetical protein [Shewanella fidelis]MDW4813300.1 hypothetical protein [Shewanella fidelis]MDW4817329.1 hypothetical protein [Shewanella fidelis]MDW4821315.1 hypothetical protein [Shewanella fidelis]MDW4824607.1 hypothetical protein [Shewanella fidelis]
MTTNPPKQVQTAAQTESVQGVNQDVSFKWLIILLALVAACLNGLYFMNFNGGWGNQADFGAFGDFLGGVLNPILGFATVGLLIWSLKMQMNELALSREQLSLTRQELKETKEETALSRQALEDQVTHLQKEASLNELMRLMSDLREQFKAICTSKVKTNNDLKNILINIPMDFYWTHKAIDNLRINKLLYEEPTIAASDSQELIIYLRNSFEYGTTERRPTQWHDLETLLTQFGRLVIKYHQLSSNPTFANIYINEAKGMLKPFQDIFATEEVAIVLGQIDGILYQSKQSELVD